MELGNWPIKVQLGSTNNKGLSVVFQGLHQGLRPEQSVNSPQREPWACPWSLLLVNTTDTKSKIQSQTPTPTSMPLHQILQCIDMTSTRMPHPPTVPMNRPPQPSHAPSKDAKQPSKAPKRQVVISTPPRALNQLIKAKHPVGGPSCQSSDTLASTSAQHARTRRAPHQQTPTPLDDATTP